jgi:hypothetical protein
MAKKNKYYNTRGLKGLLGEVRRPNNFKVVIEGIGADEANLELIMQRAFLPKVTLNPIELRHGNEALKFAGAASWEGGQITILDTLSKTELNLLLDWFHETYDTETGTLGLASKYKKTARIYEYAADGRYERSWPIEGAWISSADLGTLDATSDALKEISFVIQIDPSPLRPRYKDEVDGELYNEDTAKDTTKV